ncbi:MAG: 4Fe-4S binding protein [Desulfobacterales bacterium]|nr:4Fe-4S binding protein [Desulfobacteraceae bacterium]MBT4365642.1 4Fe-4S binding protein [Desulfobacteraceae bacterium]MBT7086049.1 4Fe-4S binding protein [Desulfobacterales bacterium]
MASEIYYQLRERIDQYSVGFAATESGIEIKILEKLFTEEEAEMYLNLKLELQSAEDIAKKINSDPKVVEELLQRMTEKGHTFPRFPKKENEPFYYAAAPYAHGILEHQLKRMNKEMADILEEYAQEGSVTRGPIPLRTIPVNAAIDNTTRVAPYDDVKKIIARKDRIAVCDCVCSVWRQTRGENCDQPLEVCINFDFYADYYVGRGMGRWISKDEALEVLDKSEKAGLVAQLTNSEDPEAICNCCPDCCGMLRGYKKLTEMGMAPATNYFSQVDSELCSGCETCIDRCPMDAITMGQEDIAEIDQISCIGCGLCITTCSDQAISLVQKPEDQIQVPPGGSDFMRPSVEFENDLKQ